MFKKYFQFAVYKLNTTNSNDIYVNGWPKITIGKPRFQ